ncbi:mitochondrial potassium channel ATP-binding subunit isoform X1 [Toxorhynchites rutilus septentrionalis]|uniref:mitochondrial potassium channel ATP-binding subunit isoform X1 n=1 Tax=Toxorhynchites rutilus septentrionalis TaxID=329112 RepID=UPI00247AC812|nr:mitochondrial potassium channel ATP-binding subunit isoform X1 [Toxorhynchites rutilus septentrionalis]
MLRLFLSGYGTRPLVYRAMFRYSQSLSSQGNFGISKKTIDAYPFGRTDLLSAAKNAFRQRSRRLVTESKQQIVRSGQTSSKVIRLLLGGTAISVTVGYQCRKWFVHCEAPSSRLVGQKVVGINGIRFDWRKLWTYLRPHLAKLVGAIIAALAVAYFNIQIPNMLGVVVNTLSKYAGSNLKDIDSTEFMNDIKLPSLRLFGMYIAQASFTFVYIFLLSQIGEQMAAKIRQDLFKQIIIQDLEFFDENRTGELVNRLTADVQDFKSSFKQCISQGLRSFAQLIGGGVSLFLISPQLASIALVSVPAAVAMFSFLGKSLRALSKKSQAQSERATSVSEEALSNIRTVRASASEYSEVELFKQETDKAAMLSEKLGIGIAVFQAMTNLFLNGMVLTTLVLGGHFMSTSSISAGDLMAFLVASQGVQRSLAQGSILIGSVIRGMTAGSRVFEYLSVQPKIDLKLGQIIPESKVRGEICFENVFFTYPCRPNQKILKDFSLTLKPGQTVALVGASGSGKSTIASLLERFYEPTGGRITIDGYNLSELSPYWLRGHLIGFIEQQPVLFGTTIYENIRYGRPDATEEEVLEAAKLSQSHQFVSQLPDGYQTPVGERGIQLSGGQRQRIAIARALLKKPTVLILDEATSALDASSEAVVQRALDAAVVDRTTLVIAHRLSTIRNADVIVVLDKGRIVEIGDHDTLIRKKGYYFELVKQQERQQLEEQQQQGQRAYG